MVASRILLSGDIIAHPLAWFELFQAFRRHPGAPGLRCSRRASIMSVPMKMAILQLVCLDTSLQWSAWGAYDG
jgi:hypothetical protein